MTSWIEFAQQEPHMAEFGKTRFQSSGASVGGTTQGGVAYLGTLRADGSPRVHPVTPILGEQLFLFMEPTSPKGKDLQRDPRYSLHCAVADSNGGEGEFYVRGRAAITFDPRIREQAVRASPYTPRDDYILFILSIEFAFMNIYVDGKAAPRRWQDIQSRSG
jgi:hypothetical protein